MITPENLVRHELIDLEVEVVGSTNKSEIGVKGKVADETYNTLKVEAASGEEKTIAKKSAVFVFTLPDGRRVEVDGKVIISRPEDRIKKKLRKW
jgi:ribonuclease P protein subunit POP4